MAVTATQQRVLCLVGLPGAGKTYRARQLEADGWVVVDDPTIVTGQARIREALATGRDVVIADPHLCRLTARIAATKFLNQFHVDVEWVYFANDLETCWHNVQQRTDGRDIVFKEVQQFSRNYTIPAGGVTVLPVCKAKA